MPCGLARVKDVLAEDYVLGEIYARGDKRVLLSYLVVVNVNVAASLRRFRRTTPAGSRCA